MKSNVRDWIAETCENLRTHPSRAPLYFGYSFYLSAWFALTSRFPVGTNIYDFDWDALIVLDACRVDSLREVADEYDFIEEVDSIWSVGSQSAEWIANTFKEERIDEVANTTYIASNGYSESVLTNHDYPPRNNTIPADFSSWSVVEDRDFASIEKVWKEYHDEIYRVVLPKTITDHAIRAARERPTDRLVVHYLQPHRPYIGAAYREGREPTELERKGYELLETGDADRENVYRLYMETLRWVLDEVEELLHNMDAEKVVITADHGEAFGEGFAYGHPEGFLHPTVRKVPWVETSATDERSREPDIEGVSGISVEVEDHLRDLGYR